MDFAKRELTGHEYEDLLARELSPEGKEQLRRIVQQGYVTVYDYVNLRYFEECYGQPAQWRVENEAKKKAIKGRLNEL